jgi:glutamate synthase domain-containing protein 3
VNVVVEGVGDHGCEYMTGGNVVILGETGRNFAAGMSGGTAYIYDATKTFVRNCNMEMVMLDILDEEDEKLLKIMISNHYQHTESDVAASLLKSWPQSFSHFVKIMPLDYKAVLDKRKAESKAVLETQDARH